MSYPKGKPAWNKGLTKETDNRVAKYSRSLTGRVFSKAHKKNIKKVLSDGRLKGFENPNWKGGLHEFNCIFCGQKHQIKKKELKIGGGKYCSRKCMNFDLSRVIKERYNLNPELKERTKHIGKNNGRWLGGLSFEPYSTDWTDKLKEFIRKRDNYICQLCEKHGNSVHHIDYDKKNCSIDNLITLCKKCHGKTNTESKREYYKKYFQNKMCMLYVNR